MGLGPETISQSGSFSRRSFYAKWLQDCEHVFVISEILQFYGDVNFGVVFYRVDQSFPKVLLAQSP